MLVSKICLTGGPCAGKTSALSKIEQELTEMGYKVFIIDEVATNLINSGIKPFGKSAISMLDFEQIVLEQQLMQEETFKKVANLLNEKCIIVCDRGIFDIKSFINNNDFDKLLKKKNLSKVQLMDDYDLVIHMNTAAKGAESFYTTENNKARTEGICDAIIRDNKCQDAWSFSNNLRIIDNSKDFESKLKEVIDNIKMYLGIQIRCEKKYLINMDCNMYKILNDKECVKVNIKQTYLKVDNDYEMMLRKRIIDFNSTYYVAIKKRYENQQEIVTSEKISKNVYERLISQRQILNEIEKERICFTYDDQLFKIDIFNNGMAMLETNKDAHIPEFVNIYKDVSLDENYKNRNIKIKKRNVNST